jgi:hypothetical protein
MDRLAKRSQERKDNWAVTLDVDPLFLHCTVSSLSLTLTL